jgi:hypothetical protein
MNCCAERILCASLANPLHFAAGGCAASDHRILIAEKTASLAAATVNTQEECHAKDFNRRVPGAKFLTAEIAKKCRKVRREDHSSSLLRPRRSLRLKAFGFAEFTACG